MSSTLFSSRLDAKPSLELSGNLAFLFPKPSCIIMATGRLIGGGALPSSYGIICNKQVPTLAQMKNPKTSIYT